MKSLWIHFMTPFATYASIIPISDKTTSESAKFQWGPEHHIPFGILFTSIITLILCVRTCFHIEFVPGGRSAEWMLWKSIYGIFGIFAPEYTLLTAVSQHGQAKKFQEDLCDILSIGCGSGEDALGAEGAFYALMGGFELRKPGEYFGTTLSPNCLLLFAKAGIISLPVAVKEVIGDKNKVNLLERLLVCTLAIWLIIDSFIRKAKGLPITLLEIHTFANLLCTFSIYALCKKKPPSVKVPVSVIQDIGLANILVSYGKPCPNPKVQRNELAVEFHTDSNPRVVDAFATYQQNVTSQELFLFQEGGSERTHIDHPIERVYFLPLEESSMRIGKDLFTKAEFVDSRSANELVVHWGQTLSVGREISITHRSKWPTKEINTLSRTDLDILSSAAASVRTRKYNRWFHATHYDLVTHRKAYTYYHDRRKVYNIGTACIPLLYSACHLAAWNAYFPSPIECWLWRASSIIVGVAPQILSTIRKYQFRASPGFFLHFIVLVLLGLLFHILARVFLVVEGFIGLRGLDNYSLTT